MAALLSTAGWAAAAERVLGRSWVVTPDAVPHAGRGAPARVGPGPRQPRAPRHPPAAADGGQDGRQGRAQLAAEPAVRHRPRRSVVGRRRHLRLAAPRRCSTPRASTWRGAWGCPRCCSCRPPRCGRRKQWGTTRPGWGRWLERRGERPVVARRRPGRLWQRGGGRTGAAHRRARQNGCCSPRPGWTWMLFAEPPDPAPLRRALGLEDRFVVGWVGSFRRFHALEQAVEAAATRGGGHAAAGRRRARAERGSSGSPTTSACRPHSRGRSPTTSCPPTWRPWTRR